MAHRRPMTLIALPLALAAAAFAPSASTFAPSASSAQTIATIATEPLVSKLSAYGGVVVWSHWDVQARLFRLAARIHGRTEVLPVAGRSVPFDVDLGPDTHGHLVAVYSRCTREQPVWVPATTPHPVLPRGCLLYRYDFASGRERRVGGIVGAGSGSFYLPTLWGNEIAYVRTRGSGAPALVAQPLSAPRRHRITAVALPGGPPGGPGPVSLDLRGKELAFAWDNAASGQLDSVVIVDTVPSSSRFASTQNALDAETSDSRSPGLIGFPSLASSGLFYGSFDGSAIVPSGDAFERISLDGGSSAQATAPHALRAQALDGHTIYAITGPYLGTFSNCGFAGCTLVAITGARYR